MDVEKELQKVQLMADISNDLAFFKAECAIANEDHIFCFRISLRGSKLDVFSFFASIFYDHVPFTNKKSSKNFLETLKKFRSQNEIL